MKTKLIFILFSVLSLTSFGQQKKVAVYMTGEDSGVKKVLGDQLVSAFSKSDKYIAVERTSSFLAELGKEQSYQRTGAVSDNEIAALGIQFGVNYVCVADISEIFGEKYISARLIDVQTAEIVNSHNVSGEMTSMNQCLKMANEITEKLTKGTFAEQAEEAKAKAAEEEQIKAEREKRNAELKAQGFVDLGLPSGTLWKEKNEDGFFKYNTATSQFGNKLPTHKQWLELLEQCQWEWTGRGYKIIGPNGKSIYLPAAGEVWNDGSVNEIGETGTYIISTLVRYLGNKHIQDVELNEVGNDENLGLYYMYICSRNKTILLSETIPGNQSFSVRLVHGK